MVLWHNRMQRKARKGSHGDREQKRREPGRSPADVGAHGFSLLYAVCVSFFYFTPLASRPDFSAQVFDNVLNPAMFLTGAALALLVKHVPTKRQAIIPAIGYLSLAAAVGLLFAAGVAQSSPPPLSPWPPRFSQAQA